MKSKQKRILVGVGVLVLFLAGATGAAVRFYPLQVDRARNDWKLRQSGAERVEIGGLSFLTRKDCVLETCTCVMLVHGLGDEARTWRKIFEVPKGEWGRPLRFFAVDLPGRGETPVPAETSAYRSRLIGERLNQVMVDRGAECSHWIMVGNSWGGTVSLWTALAPHSAVKRLVLLSPGGVFMPDDLKKGAPPMSKDIRLMPARELLRLGTVEAFQEFQKRAYFQPREIPSYVWDAVMRDASKSNTPAVLAAQTEADLPGPLLGNLIPPVLLLWGKADRVVPIEEGKRMADTIPSVVFRELDRCGHMPQKECPDRVVEAINDWIRVGLD